MNFDKRKIMRFLAIYLLFIPTLIFAMDPVNVTVVPDSTNQYGSYTIMSGIDETPFPTGIIQVEANTDSIVIIFDASTVLPSSINPSTVTVNSVASSAVSVTGQRVSILTPVDIRSRWFGTADDFNVVFSSGAKIRNPAGSGSDSLWVELVNGPGGGNIDGPQVSSTYVINTSNSVVSITAVAPSPAVAAQAAAYNIAFTTGSGGFLTGGSSTITVGFDTSTSIANGALSGVTVNGTAANAAANNDTVVVTTPVDIDNESAATVNFSLGSGITNPVSGGKYTLGVKTSSENIFVVSDSFYVASAGEFTVSAINISPTTVNTAAQYAIEFITSSTGALVAIDDTVTILFPQNTYLPDGISTSDVVVSAGGFSDNASAVFVYNDSTGNDDSLKVVMPIPAGNSQTVTITIGNTAGILNPSQSDRYALDLATTQDDSVITSNLYQITNTTTTVSQADVTPGNTDTDATTYYELDFNLGAKGRLHPGVSSITLTFNSGYTLSTTLSDYDSTRISVAGGAYTLIPTSNIDVDNTAKTIEITIPTSVTPQNSENIVLIIDGTTTDPITNPNTSASYAVNVETSVETSEVSSNTYTIGGTAVTFNAITLGDSTVNSASSYTIDITTQSLLNSLENDYVQVIFPEGTVLPTSIATGNVTWDGANPNSVTVTPSTRTVKVAISQLFQFAGTYSLVFNAAANIVNPAVPNANFYKSIISTSKDIAPVNTRIYEITGDATQVTGVTASANPGVKNASNVSHTINFTTSATGKLAGGTSAGSSTISVIFDSVTVVPGSIAASDVKINSTAVPDVSVLTSGSAGIVKLTLPDDLTIGNSTAATVLFESAAGLATNDSAGTFNLLVRTSSDTVYSDTTGAAGNYVIGDTQSLSFTSVTPNPSTQNAAASYSVKFTTGSLGALASADSIRLVFPANTFVPASISKSDVTVNGVSPTITPTIENDTLTIQVPNAIANLTNVTVLINQAAGFLNPTLVGTYTIDLMTTSEFGPYTSPTYNISQTSTTLSQANVSPSPVSPGSNAAYTIDFNAGAGGRLLAGTSTITVTFNSQTTISGTASNYDSSSVTVDGSTTSIPTSNISVSGQVLTFTIPNGVSIDNNDAVSILLAGTVLNTPIQNPGTSGDYTLQVKTSVETSNITSNSFTITSASAVTGIMLSLNPNIVNAESADTVSFRVQNNINSPAGTITVTFPANTYVPAFIPTVSVRIAHDPTDPTVYSAASAVVTNSSTRTVTITVPDTIDAGDSVRVAILNSAGLQNPSIFGNYTLKVRTSSQNIDGTSATYSLIPTTTTILNFAVTVNPQQTLTDGLYTFTFTTGVRGRLVSGVSEIFLLFPYDATFTQGVPTPSKVAVNGTASQSLTLNTGGGTDPDTLAITVPSSVTIGNSAAVTVLIDSTAGLQNASSGAALTYEGYTSVENTSQTTDYSLPVQLTSFTAHSENGMISLEWITESEVENAFWVLERKLLSNDEYESIQRGEINVHETTEPFESIAQINGRGSVASETRYAHSDSSVRVATYYAYRLSDVSYSGSVTYHEVIYQLVSAPSDFELLNNYPNPFNPSTNFKYTLPTDATVDFKIYNILGQEVFTLVEGEQTAGFYHLQWNGNNHFGAQVASGMYIVAFRVKNSSGNDYSRMMKIILIR